MKTFQQLASRLFLGVLLFAASAAHAQFTYTTNNGTITITGYNGTNDAVIIPSTINGLSVSDIGNYAFGSPLSPGELPQRPSPRTVTIPNSVTNIGPGAFAGCYALTAINVAPENPAYSSVAGVLFNQSQTTLLEYPGGLGGSYTIPPGVIDIQSEAFNACLNLTSVTIPNSVTNIGDFAFYDCLLTNVTFGDSVTSIGNYAFSGFFSGGLSVIPYTSGDPLTTVTIPSSVTNIGVGAFEGCAMLTAINVAPGNPAYSSVAGVLFNQSQTTLLQYPGGLGGSYAIPAGVTTIESNAFYYSAIASVTIPKSVTSIGGYAFYGCTVLTNVTMAEGLASIGAYAFSGWISSTIDDQPPPGACPLTSITIPSSVTNIGVGAFEACEWLTSAYFLGNAPDADSTVFSDDSPTAYYLPGTTGWAEFTTNTGVPTALWTLPYPLILNGSSGVQANQFGFTISWAANVPVVVEASADLSNPVWTPIATNSLTGGTSSFTDPDWTNYPNRFYRLRSQ